MKIDNKKIQRIRIILGESLILILRNLYYYISVAGIQFLKVGSLTERLTKKYDTSPES